jgi:hypothetical protein
MSSHWIATRLAEPWEAPSFGAAGKLNKEARLASARRGGALGSETLSEGVARGLRAVRSRSAAAAPR